MGLRTPESRRSTDEAALHKYADGLASGDPNACICSDSRANLAAEKARTKFESSSHSARLRRSNTYSWIKQVRAKGARKTSTAKISTLARRRRKFRAILGIKLNKQQNDYPVSSETGNRQRRRRRTSFLRSRYGITAGKAAVGTSRRTAGGRATGQPVTMRKRPGTESKLNAGSARQAGVVGRGRDEEWQVDAAEASLDAREAHIQLQWTRCCAGQWREGGSMQGPGICGERAGEECRSRRR